MSNLTTILTVLATATACNTDAKPVNAKPDKPNHVIAKTLYAEARGEGAEGIRRVASVIYNRGSGSYTKCIDACLKRKQFSCWNNVSDIKVNVVSESYNTNARWTDAQAWAYCLLVEASINAGKFVPVGPWTHYATINCRANWIKTMTNTSKYKNHIFGCA